VCPPMIVSPRRTSVAADGGVRCRARKKWALQEMFLSSDIVRSQGLWVQLNGQVRLHVDTSQLPTVLPVVLLHSTTILNARDVH
jgi:hypothetical protein